MADSISKYIEVCPCCLSRELKGFMEPYEINSSAYTSKSKSIVTFYHHPLFCSNCGHVFNATPPDKKTLEWYYKDQHIHFAEDFDVNKRVSWINRWRDSSRSNTLLDYGANLKRSFHSELEKQGFNVDAIDIATNLDKKSSYDIITSYFLLEHVVDLSDIFLDIKGLARLGTILILEVPTSEIYDRDYSGLLYEHQQHFSIHSLEVLASRFGFKKIEQSSEMCSRNFGFVATFIYVEEPCLSVLAQFEDVRCKYILGRRLQLYSTTHYPKEFYFKNKLDRYSALIFWGINANFENIFTYIDSNQKIIALDSNADKFCHVNSSVKCYSPDFFKSHFFEILNEYSLSYDDVCFIVTATAHEKVICPQLSNFRAMVLVYDPVQYQ
jgi:hypothetical protein